MSTQHHRVRADLEECAAAWRTDALISRTMLGGRIKFGPEEAELVADLMLEAAKVIQVLQAIIDQGTPNKGD